MTHLDVPIPPGAEPLEPRSQPAPLPTDRRDRNRASELFECIVVGVDGSPAGFEALAQAKRLLAPDGRLLAVTAVFPEVAVRTGIHYGEFAALLRAEAHETCARAQQMVADLLYAEARVVHGRSIPALLHVARDERAELLAVGTHGSSRAAGILLGSVATAMLHDASCAVLVARPAAAPGEFPRTIVVGYDGSSTALDAAAVSDCLAREFGASVRTIAATAGKPLTLERFPWREGLEWDERHPVEALVAASHEADLLIVGSRGLHGVAALGSVSERVAHRAASSVLIVRPDAARRVPGTIRKRAG